MYKNNGRRKVSSALGQGVLCLEFDYYKAKLYIFHYNIL